MPAAKRRFFRRTKPVIGKTTENIREKSSGKKTIHKEEKKQSVVATPPEKKEIQKKHIPYEFPNINRIITEAKTNLRVNYSSFVHALPKLQKKQWVLAGCFICVLGLVVWQAICVGGSIEQMVTALAQRTKLEAELTLWENIAAKYPTYRYANFKVAVIAYQLGDRQKEALYLEKTLQIDPNYIYAQTLEKLVQ